MFNTILHQTSGADTSRSSDIPAAGNITSSDSTEDLTTGNTNNATSVAFPEFAGSEDTSCGRRLFGVVQTNGGDQVSALVIVENLDDRTAAFIEDLVSFVEPGFGGDSFDVLADEQDAKEAHFGDVGGLEALLEFGGDTDGNERLFEPGRTLDAEISDFVVEDVVIIVIQTVKKITDWTFWRRSRR